jgi:hypothetical protein
MDYKIEMGNNMLNNLANVVVKTVFTEKEISDIYNLVSSTTNTDFVKSLGYNTWHLQLPEEIKEKLETLVSGLYGRQVILSEYNFSRYEKTTSDCKKYTYWPLLFPHTDEAFDSPRITLDIQLKANTDWGISVDNAGNESTYTLKDNQAVTFSGTHQVHWRPAREFLEGEYMEMIFCHFKVVGMEDPLTVEHINNMRQIGLQRWNDWSKNNEPWTSNSDDKAIDTMRYQDKNSNNSFEKERNSIESETRG